MKKRLLLVVLCVVIGVLGYLIYKHSPLSPTHNVITLTKATFSVTEEISAKIAAPADKVQATVVGDTGNAVDARIIEKEKDGETTLTVEPPISFQPGKYTLTVESEGKTYKQDFTWGVLAINSNKSIYAPNETAKLSLAVLDEKGMMVCDANVTLKIKTPVNTTDELSTGNSKIKVNPECKVKDLVTKPDYETRYVLSHAGTYELELTATTKNGTYTIQDKVEVTRDTVPFVVERESATRIYPIHEYPMNMTITANQDFEGEIIERVPYEFKISNIENSSQPFSTIKFNKNTTQNYRYQDIVWRVKMSKGQTLKLGYMYDSPDKSPYFFVAGPLSFNAETAPNNTQKNADQRTSAGQENSASFSEVFKEKRPWQIAVDDVASTLQQQINIIDQEYSSSADSFNPTDNSLGLINFDGSKYNDESVYFEADIQLDSTDDVNGNIGDKPSVFCVTSSDCKMVYLDKSNFTLRYKDCDNAECSAGTITIIDGTGCSIPDCTTAMSSTFKSPDIYCISTSDCKIAYGSGNPGADLKFLDCDDSACTTGTISLLDGGSGCVLTNCVTSGSPGESITLDCSSGASDCKITFADATSDMMFADCDTATCSSGVRRILEGASGCVLTGCNTSVAPRDFDLDCNAGATSCKIIYHDHTGSDLIFATCADATCSSGTRTILDGGSGCTLTGCSTSESIGDGPSLYCNSNTDCKVVYINDAGDDIYFADCDDATCSSGTRSLIDGGASCVLTGCSTSAIFGPTPVNSLDCSAGTNDCKFLYMSTTTTDLFFADCDDATCSTGTRSLVDGNTGCTLTGCLSGNQAFTFNLHCSASDDCKVAYIRGLSDYDLYFGDCNNSACSSGTTTYVDGAGPGSHDVGQDISMDCPTADNCKIVYLDDTNDTLRFIDCDNSDCTEGTHLILDGAPGCVLTGCSTSAASTGTNSRITCVTSSDCKIAYLRSSSQLTFADCDSETCNKGTTTHISGISITSSIPIRLDCTNGSSDCKGVTAAGSGVLYFFDCATATCSSASINILRGHASCVITGCSTTATTLNASLNCIAGSDDCKVAVYDGTNGDLFFIDCAASDCGSGTQSILDGGASCVLTGCITSGSSIGSKAEIVCFSGTDCKIAYSRVGDIYFADCDDATCSTGTTTLIDGAVGCTLTGCSTSTSFNSDFMSMYCGAVDDCKVTYYNGDLIYADCDTATCSSGTRSLLDGGASCVLTGCITLGATGFGSAIDCTGGTADCKIAYYDNTDSNMRFADCANAGCTSGTTETIDNEGELVFAQLYDSSGVAVADGIVSQRTEGTNRIRTVNPVSLSDDTDYSVRISTSDGSSNSTSTLKAARLIIPQNGSSVTDTQTQIEIGNNETTGGSSYGALAAPKIINFNPGKYSDEPSVYFEATIKNSASNTTSVILATDSTCSTTIASSEITTTGTTWTLVRTSSSIADDLTASNYYVCIKTSAGTGSIANAKLVIDQTNPAGIGYLQLYHTLGNTLVTDTDNTYTDQDFLNAIYTGSYTGGYQTEAYYEATMKTSAGTGYTRLRNDTDGTTISDSTLNTTSTSYTRVRSGNIFENLPSTIKNLDMQTSNSATNTTSIAGSWVIIEFVPPPPQIEGNNFYFEGGVGFD